MPTPAKPNPAVYPGIREKAFTYSRDLMLKSATANPHAPHLVLMDQHLPNGTMTVLATSGGEASIYLSNGGGFIGGAQSSPAIRQAALDAMAVATLTIPLALPAIDHALPLRGEIRLYFVNVYGDYVATAEEASFKAGADPLLPLANAMQNIVTQYRLWSESRKKPPTG